MKYVKGEDLFAGDYRENKFLEKPNYYGLRIVKAGQFEDIVHHD